MSAGWIFAVAAGSCAALSSTFMKLVSDSTFNSSTETDATASSSLEKLLQPQTVILLIYIALIFVTQSLMWFYFSKSLVKCGSALEATVINTACNFSLSALLGSALFGEELTLQWCFGLTLIMAGVLLIVRQTTPPSSDKKKE